MIRLGVNIDHVATIRQARGTYEPDPVAAAVLATLGGADGITVHLREDRRHIQDRDVYLLSQTVKTRLNLEMAISEEILQIAEKVQPDEATLVPEKRQELTTEGGLNIAGDREAIRAATNRLREVGVVVSLFIDPEPDQVVAACEVGADAIEFHTGPYAEASRRAEVAKELDRLQQCTELALKRGLRVHLGHGLNYWNVAAVCAIPGVEELNIGHSIVSRAVLVGMERAVREMKEAMRVG